MKKTFLLLFITALALQIKAQQVTIKPSDSLFFIAPKNMGPQQFKFSDSTLFKFKDLSKLPKTEQLAVLSDWDNKNAELFYSNMPVIKLGGNIDNMPVAKVEGNIDRMPIKSVKVVPLKDTQPVVTP